MGNSTPWLSLAIWIPIAFGGLLHFGAGSANAETEAERRLIRSEVGMS
jgi:hypothetical protein